MTKLRRIALSIGLVALATATLSGCADGPDITLSRYNETKSLTSEAAKKMAEAAPAGYTSDGARTDEFNLFSLNPNFYNSLNKTVEQVDVAGECKRMIQTAIKLGAFERQTIGSGQGIVYPLANYKVPAQIDCVQQLTQLNAEPGNLVTYSGQVKVNGGEVPFSVTFGFFAKGTTGINTEKANRFSADFNTYYGYDWGGGVETSYFGTTPPTWKAALAKRDDQTRVTEDLLSQIGGYRVKHPNENPYSEASIKNALAGFSEKNPDFPYKLKKSANGSVHAIEIYTSCVSINAFDPKHFGVADPGFGYSQRFVNTWSDDYPFGTTNNSPCPIR